MRKGIMTETMTLIIRQWTSGRSPLAGGGRAASGPLRPILLVALAAVLSLLAGCATGPVPGPRPGEETIRAWDLVTEVGVLASPVMDGRAAGAGGPIRTA